MHAGDGIAALLHERAFQNDLETCDLSRLRDTLLPKLISGDVRIESATA